jgi:hypothetical protein
MAIIMTAAENQYSEAGKNKKHAILVLGMHRSGTSAITRVINLLGAKLPSNLMAAQDDNEAGFWESLELYHIHEKLMQAVNTSWNDIGSFPNDWLTSSDAEPYKKLLLEFLDQEFQDTSLFVIKDPRICRFFLLWIDVLQTYNAEPLVVIPVRNPLEVAASLYARNGMNHSASSLIWLQHVLEAEYNSREINRSIMLYDDLLEDWQQVINKISRDLGFEFPHPADEASSEIISFLQNRLRHHVYGKNDLSNDKRINDWVLGSYEALIKLNENSRNINALTELDRIRNEFERAGVLYEPILRDKDIHLNQVNTELNINKELVAEKNEHIRTLGIRFGEQDEYIIRLNEKLDSRLKQIKELAEAEKASANRNKQLSALLTESKKQLDVEAKENDNLNRQIHELNEQLGRLETELLLKERKIHETKEQLAEAINKLEEYKTSISWKITLPLRAACNLTRSLLKYPLSSYKRYKYRKQIRTLKSTVLFDPGYYKEKYLKTNLNIQDPYIHFIESGASEGHKTHILFDTAWYLSKYPEVRDAGKNPLIHYLQYGALEGKDPNPLFHSAWYLEQNQDVANQGMNPLEHYCMTEASKGKDPNRLFSSSWYLDTYPDINQHGVNPLAHYMETGWKEKRNPHPDFDTFWYLSRNKDVASSGINPLQHYLLYGEAEGRKPNKQSGAYSAAPADTVE